MPSGSTTFDIEAKGSSYNSYRLAGTVSWSISGSTVSWTMSYTTYEWVIRMGSPGSYYWGFQGLANSAVRLYVGDEYVENTAQYSGYSYGTHANKSQNSWQAVKTGSLSATSTVESGTIIVRPTIVVPNKDAELPFILAWDVTYNGNGSTSGSTASQLKVKETSLTLSSNGFVRTNYSFLRWNTEEDGTGTDYNPGDTYSADSDLTLYAQWKKNNIPVFTNSNGTVYQVEKAYANIPGVGVKEVTVYTNVGGTIYELT